MSGVRDIVFRLRHRRQVTLGKRCELRGTPTIMLGRGGRIEIGDRFVLASTPVASHMYSGGILRMGNDVRIGHGAAIAATVSTTIGDRTTIGPFCLMMDTDFHGERARVGARPPATTAISPDSGFAPIAIGADVRIGTHVTILRGSVIGDGATIASGSVVRGRIAAGASVAGVPARAVVATPVAPARGDASGRVDVSRVIAHVFGLRRELRPEDGPDSIPEWDSLGSLKLLFALEEALGEPVDEHMIAAARSVGQIQAALDAPSSRDASSVTS